MKVTGRQKDRYMILYKRKNGERLDVSTMYLYLNKLENDGDMRAAEILVAKKLNTTDHIEILTYQLCGSPAATLRHVVARS